MLVPAPAFAGFVVGSFTKSTTGAPVTQTVAHGLGQTPKAMLFWTDGRTGTTLGANFFFGFGMTDGTNSGAIATSSTDAADPTACRRRLANKALTIVNGAGTTLAEADLQSWDSTNVVLNWTTNNATAYVVHYVALGGAHMSAKVLSWTAALATGSQSVTGTGFTPEVALHANVGVLAGTSPGTTSHAATGVSAMNDDGAQWCTFAGSVDGSATSDAQRYQRSAKSFGVVINDLSVVKEASWVSMDSNGFTVNWSTANGWDNAIFSLALRGVYHAVGCFNKATGAAPASQSITGLGFKPAFVLFSSAQSTSSTTAATHARFGIGASDGTTSGASAWQDADAGAAASADGVDKTTKAFIKVNNDTQTVDAEASLTSFDSGGFTLSWTTNDAVATEICYLALAGPRRVMVVGSRDTPIPDLEPGPFATR